MLLAKSFPVPLEPVKKPAAVVTSDQPFLCQLTYQSGDIMSSLCGLGVRVLMNNFSNTTRPRDMLIFMSADLSVSCHYGITLRHPRPREHLLLQNQRHAVTFKRYLIYRE